MRQTRRTVCNRDCPDACSILAEVEDGRVVRLKGDPAHPVTKGFLCYRTQHFLSRQYSDARLTQPLRRNARGELLPTSWDDALDWVAERLLTIRRESGGAAIFHYRSGGSLGLLTSITDHFFQRFGPVTVKRGDICSGAGEAAQMLDFGRSDSNDLFDLLNARQIVLWGKNLAVSSPHTIPVVRKAKAKGAEVTLLDPLPHRGVDLADQAHRIRPGGDFALAMAVASTVFSRGWVDPDAHRYCDHLEAFQALAQSRPVESWCEEADVGVGLVDDLAERFGRRGPVTVLAGWGMVRRRNGASILRAIDALAAVTGNIGVPGAGVSYYVPRREPFASPFDIGPEVAARSIPEPLFGRGVLEADAPPIRAVWVTAGNPVAMLPDSRTVARALETRELLVVVDAFMTDTARRADLVLPTTTLLEDDDVLGAYGHHYLGASVPVVKKPPGVKSDLEIIQGLAARTGLEEAVAGTTREWKERFVEPLKASGLSLPKLEREACRTPEAPRVAFAGRIFPTDTGRVQLIATPPSASPTRVSPEFPLLLMAVSTPYAQSSQWSKSPPEVAEVWVHPDASGGVGDGELGQLSSALASLRVRVRHDPLLRRDVAKMPKGGHLDQGHAANALIAAELTDEGEGGVLYEERVRLSPLAENAANRPALGDRRPAQTI